MFGSTRTTQRCAWILAAASLAGSIASSLFGGAAARRARKKAAQERNYRANEEKAWYDRAYNTDYLDTKAGQNLLRKAQEVGNEYVKRADGAAAVGGATASSVAQAKESANNAMSNTIANIAASDTSRKQQVDDNHHNNVIAQSREREQAYNEQAAQTTSAAQNMSNALMTAAGSLNNNNKSLISNKLAEPKDSAVAQMTQKSPLYVPNSSTQDAVAKLDPTIRLRTASGV